MMLKSTIRKIQSYEHMQVLKDLEKQAPLFVKSAC